MMDEDCEYLVVYECKKCNYRQILNKKCNNCGSNNFKSVLVWRNKNYE